MSCDDYTDAVADLARGVALDEQAHQAVRAHLDRCAACTARLLEGRQLTTGLGALAAATAGGASDALEGRLLEAFARRHASMPAGARGRSQGWRAWRGAAATAAGVVIAGAIVWWRAFAGPAGDVQKPVGDVQKNVQKIEARAAPVTAMANPGAVRAAARPPSILIGTGRDGRRMSRRPSARPQMVQPAGFVALPGAADLPEFESGVIVRIEIALPSLPSYGVPIVADAADNPVKADILVGQDGQPRAIRLVSIAAEPRSRQ